MKKLIPTLFAFAALAAASPAFAQTYYPTSYPYSYPTYSYPAYPSQSPGCPAIYSNLYIGLSDYSTGGQVSQLQRFLAGRYGNQSVTGYFGFMTRANVARFQQEQGVYPITGGVGPLTRAAIARVCGGGGVTPGSSVFYLNTPFTVSQGTTLKQYQGQLDFTLNRVNTSPYTLYTYPGYSPAVSATITLGQSCIPGTYCFYYPTQQFELTVGQSVAWQSYTVTLLSLTQTTATFTVSQSGSHQQATVSVNSPAQGTVVSHGQTLNVAWSTTNVPQSGSTVVDLYTVSGSKVGTIAIQSGVSSGNYNWVVPTPNTICTLQYPNGLCGQNLSGQYFIKVSLVSGNGFDGGAVFASGNSGTFTVQ